jgi:putative transposase
MRLPDHDYALPGAYFVTVCALNRECILSRSKEDRVELLEIGLIVHECWTAIPEHHRGWAVDEFVVMPNHVHGILMHEDVGAGYIRPLQRVMSTFKAAASRRVGGKVWQRGYHDRVIRDEEELAALREYIQTNPLRWALDRENPEHQRPEAGPVGARPLRF